MTHNIRLFEVGGSIRDELMGIDNPPDRDFCAESPGGWEELLAWCHENMKKVFLVTPKFFTVRGQMPNGTAIDVVMCRKDSPFTDGRHPESVEPGTLMDDLARRDFTVNAMAREVDPKTLEPIGDIIDPGLRGQIDIKQKWLRFVGEPEVRLMEDGLRLLRAVRFTITKDLKMTRDVEKLVKDVWWWDFMIDKVSIERVREELQKMMKHNTVDTLFFLSRKCPAGATRVLFDGIWLKPTLEKK